MKFFISLFSYIICFTLLNGCASILSGTEDRISINSMTTDTTILIDDIPRGKNGIEVTVDRGQQHTITVAKTGCKSVSIETGQRFDYKSLLGIFIDFGVVSIPVDFFSGAALKTHPSSYTISPQCDKPM